MKNILMGVSYLGTNYAGWQKQDNALAIQEVIENALYEICGTAVETFASGRTDAGVHAYEQCFSCKLNFKDIKRLPIALNTKLPEDIRILWSKEMPNDFHARFSAHKKTYTYRIRVGEIESPFDFQTTTYISYNLNLKKMQEASSYLVGEHNFKSFCSSHTTVPDYVRTIYELNIKNIDNLFEFEITGNGFLYNMVRIIVGTLLDVGRGKTQPKEIIKIINGQNRQLSGKTMPAKGLVLKKVEY